MLTALTLMLAAAPALAESPLNDVSGGALDTATEDIRIGPDAAQILNGEAEDEDPKEDFVIVPIPGANPTIGAYLSIGAAYFYSLDEGSEASYTGAGVFASVNGSGGWGVLQSVSWLDDRLRANAAFGRVDLRYDLYGIGAGPGSDGLKLPIDQLAYAATGDIAYGVSEHVYLGVKGRYLESDLSFNVGAAVGVPGLPPLNLNVTSGVVGPTIEIDARDNQFAPRSGFQIEGEILFSVAQSVNQYSFQRTQVSANYYLPVFEKDSIAFRAAGCNFSGSGAFFEMCLLGANDGLRGYPVGQYIDSALFSAQVEYRGRISESWGYVGFAGVGAVAPQFSGLIDREPLPSAGAGIRYRVSEKNQLDLSLDVTVSKADSAIYLYVGQSF
jgi:hypothetical protein